MARYAVLGGVMDFTVYIALSLVPLISRRWGAGPIGLGCIPLVGGISYALTALAGGRICDRFSRTTVARFGLGISAATFAAFALATRPWHFYLGLPVVAFGLALFWPALQAAIADESDGPSLARNLGVFNMAWSAGKGLGVLAGGILVEISGTAGFLGAAAIAAGLFVLMPNVPSGGGGGRPLFENGATAPRREGFRAAALVANFAAYGLATTIINLYTLWNGALGRGGESYGIVVGTVFLFQTIAFGILMLRPGWPYRLLPMLGPQVVTAAGAALLATRWPVAAAVGAAAAAGLGLGVAYAASIYYSLHTDAMRGRRAGLHEAILGSGNLLIPLLGGVAARLAGVAWFPCVFAAGVLALSVVVQAAILARRGERTSGDSAG
ncbi:MAG: MFS transporter [Planctomycetes bacterium]|nr:MFS transporter [Planctomycetota bacterium]